MCFSNFFVSTLVLHDSRKLGCSNRLLSTWPRSRSQPANRLLRSPLGDIMVYPIKIIMRTANENNHNAHVNPTGLGPVQAYSLCTLQTSSLHRKTLARKNERKEWNGAELAVEWAEFINLRHKVASKRVPRKFVATARPFSVKCKWSPVSGELQNRLWRRWKVHLGMWKLVFLADSPAKLFQQSWF